MKSTTIISGIDISGVNAAGAAMNPAETMELKIRTRRKPHCTSSREEEEHRAKSQSPKNKKPEKSNRGIPSPKRPGLNRVVSPNPRPVRDRLIQKIHRHVKKVVTTPPTGGPMTGPINAGI